MSSKYKILLSLFITALISVSYLFYISEKVVFIFNNNIVAEADIAAADDENETVDNNFIAELKKSEQANNEEEDTSASSAREEEGEESAFFADLEDSEDKDEKDNLNIDNDLEKLSIVYDVPFTPQAPFARWDDPIHQDGCEEAASLMAVSWARGENLSQAKAKKEIVAASVYQTENYGEYRDTSIKDTAERIIKGYFGYGNIEVKTGITIKDIIFELINGNIVILPMDGQALDNPYYTPPGPERHNIVVRGYDEEQGEFITNDPGTKRGNGYRYNQETLYNAIRDYPTGYHVPVRITEKTMIVVSPG